MWFCENFDQHHPEIFSVSVPTFRNIFPSQMIFRSLRVQQPMSQECPMEVNKAVLEYFGKILKFGSTCQMKQKIFVCLLAPKIKKRPIYFQADLFLREKLMQGMNKMRTQSGSDQTFSSLSRKSCLTKSTRSMESVEWAFPCCIFQASTGCDLETSWVRISIWIAALIAICGPIIHSFCWRLIEPTQMFELPCNNEFLNLIRYCMK